MLDGAHILCTGGTGSFGRKFIQTVLHDYKPARLIIFSRDECKQHEMRGCFPDGPGSPVRYFLGDVRDTSRLRRALHDVDIVVHAAALKVVPSCEYNPREAVQTNIGGAMNVVEAALDCGVQRVLALSTDKAVSPTNIYGATKLVMEKLMVQANAYRGQGGTRFACTRYGNVADSRGSVIPLFREQRKAGRITITDDRMNRFLITLPQAVGFVLACLERMVGGEIFVPRMPSVQIGDLADAIAPGCERAYIGIRPGEKLSEALVSADEAHRTVDLGDHYVILPSHSFWPDGHYADAPRVPDGWSYTSANNTEWLTVEELRGMVEGKEDTVPHSTSVHGIAM